MIGDLVNNENGHREQASISHHRAHKAAIHGGVVLSPQLPFGEWLLIQGQIKTQRQTFYTLRLNCGLENDSALRRRTKAGCGGTDVLILKCCLDARICSVDVNWSACLCVHSQSLMQSMDANRSFSRLQQSKPAYKLRVMGSVTCVLLCMCNGKLKV